MFFQKVHKNKAYKLLFEAIPRHFSEFLQMSCFSPLLSMNLNLIITKNRFPTAF